jgi:hypothetical protein
MYAAIAARDHNPFHAIIHMLQHLGFEVPERLTRVILNVDAALFQQLKNFRLTTAGAPTPGGRI